MKLALIKIGQVLDQILGPLLNRCLYEVTVVFHDYIKGIDFVSRKGICVRSLIFWQLALIAIEFVLSS